MILRLLFSQCIHFSHARLFEALWTDTQQTPLSMGFSRQEYQSGLPFPFPGDLPDPEMESFVSCIADGFFMAEPGTSRYSSKVCFKKSLVNCLIIIALLNGEGNGTPLQFSCLENPMDGGAW